jgi:outer membrane protein OmpA-like peptidoglycan-associated protein
MVIDMATGNIRFNDGLLFDSNSSTLSPKGQDYLNRFFPVFVQTLTEGKYKDYLEGIIIEGHADDGGSYVINIELSEKRSLNTIRYIIDKKLVPIEITDKYLTFSGRSFALPVTVNGNIDRNLSRRVEFCFRLKDDKLSQDMLEALK